MKNDLKFAVRQLLRNPGFALVAVLTLVLGIGANTAVFSLIYALLLRYMPVPQPEQLRFISQVTPEGEQQGLSYAAYLALREQCRSLAAMGSINSPGPTLARSPSGNLEQVRREYAGAGYFAALGFSPAAGRFFTYEEDRAESAKVIISHRYWQRHYNLDPKAIGSILYPKLAKPYTIIGVMPPGYSGIIPEYSTDIWFQESDGRNGVRNEPVSHGWYKPLARLKPGVSEEQALAELNGLFRGYLEARTAGLSEAERAGLLGRRIVLTAGGSGFSPLGRQLQKPLLVLMILVGLVLLLACANIGNMLLARTATRAREIAIRLAVGASRRHLIRQMLLESLVLAGLGGLGGALFAYWGARVLMNIYGLKMEVSLDFRLLAFTAGLALGSGLLFGLLPAWQGARARLAPVLKSPGLSDRRTRWSPGKWLVISQVALSIILLTGAGLFVRTLANLLGQETGFAAQNVIMAFVVTTDGYSPKADPAIWRLIEKMRQIPTVTSVATGVIPENRPRYSVRAIGYPASAEDLPEAQLREGVSDGLFETLRTPILQGRAIARSDCGRNKPKVAVVNESFARCYFGPDNPLGKQVELSGNYGMAGKLGPFEIIGVVADARYASPKEKPTPEIFVPNTEFWGAHLLVRTTGKARALMAALPQLVRQSEPDLRVIEMKTMEEAVNANLVQERLLASLSGFFGLTALLLASLGIFGVISYSVHRRTREFGVRMALGARPGLVLWMVLQETLLLLGIGVAMGIPLILAGGRFLNSMLFGLPPTDPVTLIAAVLVLSGVALLAGYIPARRAAQVHPMAALRYD